MQRFVLLVGCLPAVGMSAVTFVGASRVPEQALHAQLPNAIFSQPNESLVSQGIASLHATGNFERIDATLEGQDVTFHLVERPLIAEVVLSGNRLIPKAAILEGFKTANLAQGDVLNPAILTAVIQEIQTQYVAQGYHNSQINVDFEPLEGNRVRVLVDFVEGKAARTQDIRFIGNTHFTDEELKDILTLVANGRLKKGVFTQQKLQTSLNRLLNHYKNAGFFHANIRHHQVIVDENLDQVTVEIGLDEGTRYTFAAPIFVGQHDLDQATLEDLSAIIQDGYYSAAAVQQTSDAIGEHLSRQGYFLASVEPHYALNDETKQVAVQYVINQNQPVRVRRINFSGNIKTKDTVLRREMRQMEGALANSQALAISRARLMQTGYFQNVILTTDPVPSTHDQIDVNIEVVEQPSGSTSLAAGYSQGGGVTFQADLSQNNFLGTGNKVTAAFARSQTQDSYNLGFTNPYLTKDGISGSANAYYRKTKYDNKNVSNFVTDSYGATLSAGYPINERQRLSFGVNLDDTTVKGGQHMAASAVMDMMQDGGTADLTPPPSFQNSYKTANAILGWQYSSLDKPIFPTKGMSHHLDITLGGGDKTYQKAVYRGNVYQPLGDDGFGIRGYTKLGYGENLPFYENFYAGGYGSVRGYRPSSLGPKSQTYAQAQNPKTTTPVYSEEVGGNALASLGAELILPMPFKGDWTQNMRPVVFVEGGQVFDTQGKDKTVFNPKTVNPNHTAQSTTHPLIIQDKKMRYSAGVASTWYTPIGPISLSYAKPIGNQDGDRTETVQFQIGNVF